MKLVRVLALAALGLVPSAVAQAQTQATSTASITDGVIYACYVPKTGTVYRINVSGSPIKCATNHVLFSWNISGPEGPQGPEGPAGSSAFSSAVLRTGSVDVLAGEVKGLTVKCEADEIVVNGGYSITTGLNNEGEMLLNQAEHVPQDPQPWRWHLVLYNGSGFLKQLHGTALCVKIGN